ncbi:FecR family protein [Sphingobacterium sp. LRF_L2]|uniref:FecR family protein n=1 Tax=Sphingobacterium sp. LRF_L2 TaxID=3369421 RepID=UPI003F62D461
MEKYNVYTVQDFLDDMDFLMHVKYPDGADAQPWIDWRQGNPPNADLYDEARFYLQGILGLVRLHPTQSFANRLYEDIESGIQKNSRLKKSKEIRLWVYRSAAAAILLFVTLFWYFTSLITISTGNGEVQVMQLPDSSVVHINANSSVAYHRAWTWYDKREVYTTGEVLFEVKHLNKDNSRIKTGDQFVAYSGDIAVEVLGTKFNIKNRDAKITVSLLEGKIALRNLRKPTEVKLMTPGNAIMYTADGFQEATEGVAKIEQSTSWSEKNLVAENLSIGDLINEFRYIYGREIVVTDSSLLNKRIDGRISLNSQESIIYSLANILEANIRLDKDTVYLDPK